MGGQARSMWRDGRANATVEAEAVGVALGADEKRSALHVPAQRIAMADAACCDGHCTALHHLPGNAAMRRCGASSGLGRSAGMPVEVPARGQIAYFSLLRRRKVSGALAYDADSYYLCRLVDSVQTYAVHNRKAKDRR